MNINYNKSKHFGVLLFNIVLDYVTFLFNIISEKIMASKYSYIIIRTITNCSVIYSKYILTVLKLYGRKCC